MEQIYLDNAATAFPKAPGVSDAMKYYIDCVGANIGRASYGPAQAAAGVTLSLRERLCRLFDLDDPALVILTSGATAALNLAILGALRPGDHCITGPLEHNAVMRPLHQLAARGVTFDRLPCGADGRITLSALDGLFRPNTRLVVVSHASNVCGTIQDIEAIGRACAVRDVPFLVDAAQSAGHLPLRFRGAHMSALALPGHKGLLGPQGIGALLLRRDFAADITPLITGGTGSASDKEIQPDFLPDKFEAGTANLPGIYGWEAALAFVEEKTVAALRAHEQGLTARFLAGLKGMQGLRLLGTAEADARVGVAALDFTTMDNAEAALRLEERGILTRCGLHCAPNAHRCLGSFPQGAVRFSWGWATTEAEIDAALNALEDITALV